MILVDSDVLIWLTRGHDGARQRLSAIDAWELSVVTYVELVQGCRSKAEHDRLKRGLAIRNVRIHPLTPAISERAMRLIDEYALSHGLQLADALIAATAMENALTLLTGNMKHFGSIAGLQVEAFTP